MTNSLQAIDRLVRPNIRQIEPMELLRHTYSQGLFLDANENCFGPILNDVQPLHRYPDPSYRELRKALSDYLGCPAHWTLPTNGSNEGLDLIFKTFVDPTDTVVLSSPCYGVYGWLAEIYQANLIDVPLDGTYDLSITDMLRVNAKLSLLCSPNNPTGNLLSRNRICRYLEATNGVVVIDEAYVECASDDATVVGWVKRFPHLLVLRTFSKLWGLAGARIGYIVGQPAALAYLSRVQMPYSVNRSAADVASRALLKTGSLRHMRQRMWCERAFLHKELVVRHWKVFASEANFLLAHAPGDGNRVSEWHRALAENGVFVRDVSHLRSLHGCMRFTVGTRKDNRRLLTEIDNVCAM